MFIESEEGREVSSPESSVRRQPTREKKLPNRFDDYVVYANFVNVGAPANFEEAVNSSEREKWRKAMKKEFDALNEAETWKLVDQPQNKEILNVKWIYNVKNNGVYKARVVVRGFEQTDQISDVYAPVAKMSSLKSILALSCIQGYRIHQMDVITAFLNSCIRSEVYVKQPEGCIKDPSKVYQLKKSLYGLKESPRNWYEHFNDFIVSLGFSRSGHDPCLYTNVKENLWCIIFVDDILICGATDNGISKIKEKFKVKFKMTDLGPVKSYLGIDIVYDEENKVMALSQAKYIEDLAIKYDLSESNMKYTPMEINLKLEKGDLDKSLKYRNLIGALLYISQGTRPDVSFSVNFLSRFQTCCSETHFRYACRILVYLYATRHMSLKYCNTVRDVIDCYVDSDWAGDSTDAKSTTGFVIRVFGNPVLWKTVKQKTVSRSSTYAEYYALADAVQEALHIKGILKDLGIKETTVKVYEDNSGALALAQNGNFTKWSKHINVAYHFVNDFVNKGLIKVIKIPSADNMADTLTKALRQIKFEFFRLKLNVCY